MAPDCRGEVDRKRLHPRGQHRGHARRHGPRLPLSGYSAVAHVKGGRHDGRRGCNARANRGYTLYSRRTGGPVARLRPTGKEDNVQVLWWRREAWATPGDFGLLTLPLDEALDFVATEGFFWINA